MIKLNSKFGFRDVLPPCLGVLVAAAGLVVMAGWIWNIPAIISINPEWGSMKFTTALSFFLSGVMIWFIARRRTGEGLWAEVVVPACALIILLIMTTFLVSTLMQVRSGVEDFLFRGQNMSDYDPLRGRPSVGTMFSFVVFSLVCLLAVIQSFPAGVFMTVSGWMLVMTGVCATASYAGAPVWLRWEFPSWSSAIAFHTGLLFMLLGCAFLLMTRRNPER